MIDKFEMPDKYLLYRKLYFLAQTIYYKIRVHKMNNWAENLAIFGKF